MIKNEFSKKCQDFRINTAEATIVLRVFPRDLRIYDTLIVGLALWYDFICRNCVFLLIISAIMKVFVGLEITTSFQGSSLLFPEELAIYLARITESSVIFLSIISLRTWLLIKEYIFLRQYAHSTYVYSFWLMNRKPSHAWVVLEI